MSLRIHDLEKVLKNVKDENDTLSTKLSSHSKKFLKGKVKASNVQIDPEAKLSKINQDLAASLKRNKKLEENLVKTKEELNKSL